MVPVIFGVLLVLYLVLLFALPKGNIFQEMINLPPFWIKLLSAPQKEMSCSRHFYGEHRRQYYLFCQPTQIEGPPKKLILYFHGGGWRVGAPEYFKANAKVFTDEGFAVLLPSYRRTPKFNYYDLREDLDLLLQSVQALLADKAWAGTSLVLGGMSAGGNLAALAFYDRQRLANLGFQPAEFAGAFFCGAPLDLSSMTPSRVLKQYAGPSQGEMFRAANPIEYLEENECLPVLVIHGERDGLVAYESARSFVEKRKGCDAASLTVHTIPQGTHLDASKWAYQNAETRKVLLEWLKRV